MLSRKEILENFAEPSVSSVICALVFVCVYPNSVYIQMNILIPRINADSLLCKYACIIQGVPERTPVFVILAHSV